MRTAAASMRGLSMHHRHGTAHAQDLLAHAMTPAQQPTVQSNSPCQLEYTPWPSILATYRSHLQTAWATAGHAKTEQAITGCCSVTCTSVLLSDIPIMRLPDLQSARPSLSCCLPLLNSVAPVSQQQQQAPPQPQPYSHSSNATQPTEQRQACLHTDRGKPPGTVDAAVLHTELLVMPCTGHVP